MNIEPHAPEEGILINKLSKRRIYRPDGRELVFLSNVNTNSEGLYQDETYNWLNIHISMAKRGIVIIPEMAATDIFDHEMPGYVPIYADARLGWERVDSLISFVIGAHPELRSYQRPSAVPAPEIQELVDLGIRETGMDILLLQIRQQDAACQVGEVASPQNPTEFDTGL